MPAIPVVTVDGPSGTGKGMVSIYLAENRGWHLLDSGAMYRAVAQVALDRGTDLSSEAELADIAANLVVSFQQHTGETVVLLDGDTDISAAIRMETCGNAASQVAVLPGVREALLHKQRQFRRPPGLVADGRDMGTVVFPDAQLKIFLTASPETRAQRRYKQLKDKGNSVNLARLSAEIKERDARDEGRNVSPLLPAPDAIIIDTSELTAEAVCRRVSGEVTRVFGSP